MRVTLFLVLSFQISFGQDSLVRFNELTYASGFERNAFKDFKRNQADYLALLLATDASSTEAKVTDVRSRINVVKDRLLSSGIDKKKPDKKIKSIYEQVHSTFLKKYELENRFPEVFANGNYNCVTATALFAFVLQDLDVPYAIQELPTHVFLVAYPNNGNILVETTSPLMGYMSFDERYKAAFVTNLKKQKIIGSSEAETSDTESLFNKYYFQNEKIDMKQLVGIHYINDALFEADHDQLKEAFQQAEKGYMFYPSLRCKYVLAHLGSQILSKEKLPPLERCTLIGKISRYKDQGITEDMIQGEFINLTQDVLTRQNNKELYAKCYKELIREIDSKELKDEISYLYNYENGRIYYNQGDYQKAKVYFANAMALQPNNVDLGSAFISTLAQSFRTYKQSKPALDTLKSYEKKFPSLSENNKFNSMLGTAYVIQFGEEYKAGKTAAGDECRKTFESLLAEKSIIVDSQVIGQAYSNAVVYYFKKGQKSKAREVLNKGLELAPDSYELRMRQQMMGH